MMTARKMKNGTEFSLVKLNLLKIVAPSVNRTDSYCLCGVTNHYGIQDAGHYITLCRSWDEDTQYKCDDQNVTTARMSGKSNATYLFSYKSPQ